jgi:hypothetical protein
MKHIILLFSFIFLHINSFCQNNKQIEKILKWKYPEIECNVENLKLVDGVLLSNVGFGLNYYNVKGYNVITLEKENNTVLDLLIMKSQNDYIFFSQTCDIYGINSELIIAWGSSELDSNKRHHVTKCWVINKESAKFNEIPIDGVSCVLESYCEH